MSKSVLIILGAFLVLAVGAGVVIAFNSNTSSTLNTSKNTISTTSVQTSNTTPEKAYSLTDISTHASKSDCWMAIDGGVYDVTKYINAHPGGNAILDGCGKDATELFHNRPDGQKDHSQRAVQLLKSFKVGTLQ